MIDLLPVISHPVTLQSISCAGGEATSGTSPLTLRSARLRIEPSIPAVTVKNTCGNLCQISRCDAPHLGLVARVSERRMWMLAFTTCESETEPLHRGAVRGAHGGYFGVSSLCVQLQKEMCCGVAPVTTRENIHCKAVAKWMEQ